MKPWRQQRQDFCFERRELNPPDLAKGVERNRARFRSEIMIDPSTWDIARTLHRKLRGETGEGLRGLFVSSEGEHGRLYWWFRDAGAHHQARLMLGYPGDRTVQGILEVEMNVDHNGTIYPCWNQRSDGADEASIAFLAHPTIGALVDGSLTRAGRQIVLKRDGTGIRLLKEPAPDVKPYDDPHPERAAQWQSLRERLDTLSRTRSRSTPEGQPMPDRRSLACLRLWMKGRGKDKNPLPDVRTTPEGAMRLTWRATDRMVSLTFGDQEITMREVHRGYVRQETYGGLSTWRRMLLGVPHFSIHKMRSHDPDRSGKVDT